MTMPDHPEAPSQREADLRIERIEGKIDEIPVVVRAVIEGGDYQLPGGMSPKDLLADHAELHASNRRIITALDGPETGQAGLDGRPLRQAELGLVSQGAANTTGIANIEEILGNGVKTKMDPAVKVALITASGAVAAAAAIAGIPGLVGLLT